MGEDGDGGGGEAAVRHGVVRGRRAVGEVEDDALESRIVSDDGDVCVGFVELPEDLEDVIWVGAVELVERPGFRPKGGGNRVPGLAGPDGRRHEPDDRG